jgi:polysaccharide pyruvyl transferase WcaK-like protein
MALSRGDVDVQNLEFGIRSSELEEASDDPGAQSKPLLFVSMRCWKDNMQARKGWDVLLVPAHYPDDMEAASMLVSRMATRPYCIDRSLDAREFMALTAFADTVFSMRLHGLICAMAMGTPIIGLSYDPKVDAFMEQSGAEKCCLHYDSFDVETANTLMDELRTPTPDSLREREARRQEMRNLAWNPAEMALELLNGAAPQK